MWRKWRRRAVEWVPSTFIDDLNQYYCRFAMRNLYERVMSNRGIKIFVIFIIEKLKSWHFFIMSKMEWMGEISLRLSAFREKKSKVFGF